VVRQRGAGIALVGISLLDGRVGYLAPEGFLAELREEPGDDVSDIHGRLVLAKGPAKAVAWAPNIWCDPMRIPTWPPARQSSFTPWPRDAMGKATQEDIESEAIPGGFCCRVGIL